MRRILASAAALTIVGAVPLLAQGTAAPGQRQVSAVTGGMYEADPAHTLVEWEIGHLGFSPYFGIFGDVTGTLQLDPKAPQNAKLAVTIPISKVTTPSAALTQHLLRAPKEAGGKPDFFGPSPADATFVSTAIRPKANNMADVTGNLTFNGVTRPVTLATRFYGAGKLPAQMGGGEGLGFEATTTIKRSDFGFNQMIPMLSDEVKLKIAAAFIKKG